MIRSTITTIALATLTLSSIAQPASNSSSVSDIRKLVDQQGWLKTCRQYGDQLKELDLNSRQAADDWEDAVFIKAGCLSETRRDYEASHILEEALTIAPNKPILWDMLGTSYLRMKQPEKAIGSLQKAIDKGREGGSLHSKIANAYLQLGAPLHARKDASRKSQYLDQAEKHLRKAMKLENLPDSPIRYAELGGVKLAQGQYAAARELFSTAIELLPNYKYWDKTMQGTMKAEYTMLLGQSVYMGGDKALGKAYMEGAIEYAPSQQLKSIMQTIADNTTSPSPSPSELEKREPALTATPFVPLNE